MPGMPRLYWDTLISGALRDDAAKVRSLWRFLPLVYLEDPPTRRLG